MVPTSEVFRTIDTSVALLSYPGAIAKDPKTSEKEKDACLAFVEAEGKLDKEDRFVYEHQAAAADVNLSISELKREMLHACSSFQDVDGCLSLSKTAVQKFEAP